jgi:NAD(P)H dehydrogenase (quinone)
MSIVVTGATGKLGRLVVESLLRRGVAPAQIVAAGRAVERLGDLADQGVRVSQIHFEDPASLRAAFAGASRLLLISGSEVGSRERQHGAAIDAAKEVGVGEIAYTSIAHADTSTLLLAGEHQATERLLRASGLPVTLLRNSWYLEVYTDQLPSYLANGGIIGSAGQGRVSGATRADYADAAAAVLTGDGHAGKVYELGGDDSYTLADLAAAVAEHSGKPIAYQDLPVDQYRQALVGFGLPEALAAVYADADRGIAAGELLVDTKDLSRLSGHPTTPMSAAVAAALAGLPPSA